METRAEKLVDLRTLAASALSGGVVALVVLLAVGLPEPPAPEPPPPDPFPADAQELLARLHHALWKETPTAAAGVLDAVEARARAELLGDAPPAQARQRVEALVAASEAAVEEALVERGRAQPRIAVSADQEDLAAVARKIGRRVGATILVDPNVQERVDVELRDIPWREAVDVIAKLCRCEVEEQEGGILLLTQPPKVTIQFTDANVRTVLQLLAAYSGQNVIITPDVVGSLTVDLKSVQWLKALRSLARSLRCHVYRIGPELTIVSKAELPELRPGAQPAPQPSFATAVTRRIRRLVERLRAARVTLAVEDLAAGAVAERIEAQTGRALEVDPDLAGERVRLNLWRVERRAAVAALAAQVGGRVVDDRRLTRIALRDRVRLTADGAPAAAWFALLSEAGLAVRVVPAARTRRVSLDLHDLDLLAAARASAAAIGCELTRQPEAYEVRPRGAAPKPKPPRRVTVTDARGHELRVVYQGSAIVHDQRLALLDGVVVRRGEVLRRPNGRPTGLRIAAVEPHTVVLEQTGGERRSFRLDGAPE